MLLLTSLNVRGLRAQEKIRHILYLLKGDIVCLQETRWDGRTEGEVRQMWEGDIFTNNGTINSCGVAVLFKKDLVDSINIVHKDKEGRVLIIDFFYLADKYRIINIYAANNEANRKAMFRDLQKWVTRETMMVGDFNTFLTKSDISRNMVFKQEAGRMVLRELMQKGDLIDIWRITNLHKREYSRQGIIGKTVKQSRIDLLLVSGHIAGLIHSVTYNFNSYSDHASLSWRVGEVRGGKGGGVWCLNSSLLEDMQYRNKINKILQYTTENLSFDQNHVDIWDNLKEKIKKASINYSKEKRWKEGRRERELREQITTELQLIDSEPDRDNQDLKLWEKQLGDIEKGRCRGAAIRSKIQTVVEGEKCTAFFLGLEKYKQGKLRINELKNENGKTEKEADKILDVVRDFYAKLFSNEVVNNPETTKEMLKNVDKKIDIADKEWCDSDITLSEVENAIDGLNTRKSPGSDGLPSEFFVCFKEQLAPLLLDLYRQMQSTQSTPDSLTTGIITLIYKKGDKDQIRNYRPISLLNTDYKILTKILANRLKTVIGQVIGHTQTYSIPGRDIADSIHTVRDTAREMTVQGGYLLGIDLEKAFDRVEHFFLWEVLERVGFGIDFIKWVKLLYSGAKSRVKVNGFLTGEFNIKRSVRQGCPLSSLLYSLVAEPLATTVLADRDIVGIETRRHNSVKITQFADDINFTIQDTHSIDRIMTHLQHYERASGAKVNRTKSDILIFNKPGIFNNKWGFNIVTDNRKVLGIYVGTDETQATDRTWDMVIKKINNIITLWKSRGLTLRGKAVVINALLLSKISHILGCCELPQWALNSLNRKISAFLWKGLGHSIAHSVLIAKKREGGLGMIDIGAKRDALRVKMVSRFLDPTRQHPWEDSLAACLSEYGERGLYNLCALFPRKDYSGLPGFYQEVLEAWGKILPHLRPKCSEKGHVLRLPFLQSPWFLHNNKIFNSEIFRRAGITRVWQVVDGRGNFDVEGTWRTIRERRVGGSKAQVRDFRDRFERGIGEEWKRLLGGEGGLVQGDPLCFLLCLGNCNTSITEVKTRTWYRIFSDKITRKPTANTLWQTRFPDKDITTIWHNLEIPFMSHQSHNLDFKTRHRRLYTGVVLHQIHRDLFGRVCSVCKSGDEDLEHVFFNCGKLRGTHTIIQDILIRYCGLTIMSDAEWKWTMLFGVCPKPRTNAHLVNTVLATARATIWCRRNFAMYEQKQVPLERLYLGNLGAHFRSVWECEPDRFKDIFTPWTTLFRVEGSTLHLEV